MNKTIRPDWKSIFRLLGDIDVNVDGEVQPLTQWVNSQIPKEITAAEAIDLLIPNAKLQYEPIGLFYVHSGFRRYTAFDNSTGSAWTEDFRSKKKMLKWLRGEYEVDGNN